MKKLTLLVTTYLSILGISYCQDASKFEGNLIEFLTEVQQTAEGQVLIKYCDCKDSKELINAYYNLRTTHNRFINYYVTELTLMKVKSALSDFKTKNTTNWVRSSAEMKSIYQYLAEFSKLECEDEQEIALATAISVAEITGLANTVIGFINKSRDRKDTQRTNLLKILESLKLPSLTEYKCNSN